MRACNWATPPFTHLRHLRGPRERASRHQGAHGPWAPGQAVESGQNGQYEFVVKAGGTVESRPVTASFRTGQDVVIESGLSAGETVVTEGQLRLAPGMRVEARNPRTSP